MYGPPELRREMKPMPDDYRWQKITILLNNGQVASLDEIKAAMRRRTGCAISRSGLIRAIVVAVDNGYPELVSCSSEIQLCEKLRQRLCGHSSTIQI